MPLIDVALPTGGRVWLRTRLTHAQAGEREYARAAIPAASVGRIEKITVKKPDLSVLDDRDIADVTRAIREYNEATIRVCVHHAADVTDPDGQAIRLPDDLDKLDESDFRFLLAAAEGALSQGRGDPLPTRDTSATPSSADGSAETSPATSVMPS